VRLSRYVPMVAWLPSYTRAQFARDAVAGTTTAVLLVPQAMAYAMLAGLPPAVGLYASVVPLILYAVFGTSRQLAVGPVAMVSLLVATAVGGLVPIGTAAYASYAVLLALMVGVIQVSMGIARLGFLTNFLSHPVLSGFTSAAAIIIGVSQLGHFFGIKVRGSHQVHETLIAIGGQLDRTHGYTLLIGVTSVILLLALKRIDKRFPSALVVVVLATLAVWGFDLAAHGVRIVGKIPSGMPSPELPALDPVALRGLWPAAVTISLVGFMESIAVAKSFARRNGYEVEPNQELIGLGVANLGAALFRAFPVTGGFSRTAVNAQAGAQTSVASLVTAGFVGLTLLFLTPLFHDLPQSVLAAIIMTAVFGLVDFHEVLHLWRVKRSDLLLLLITFLATLTIGIDEGILIGVAASLLWFVVRTTRPHFAVLGRLPGSRVFRNVARYPEAETRPGVLVVRMDAQFYFGNVSFLRDTLRRLEAQQTTPLRALVLDATSINQLDSSADTALTEIQSEYQQRGVVLYIAGAKGPVLDVMRRSGLYDKLGERQFFFEVADAWDSMLREPSVALAAVGQVASSSHQPQELARE
jgi:sulfate permease, SulP family